MSVQRRQGDDFDVNKLDPAAQKAFQYAVDFYEKDHLLTPSQRSLLAQTYSTISSTTLIAGWGTFFAVSSVPFYRQKLRTGSTKGTNVGIAMLFGIGAMMFASPFAATKSYNWQLEKLRQSDERCFEVAQLLKPAESSKWWMYYKLTADHPEHIMKDPRSKEAAEQRKKTIYSGRDPMGLYSGPRAEMSKRRVQVQDADEVGAGASVGAAPTTTIAESTDDDDPFSEKPNIVPTYGSAWDQVRHTNGIESGPEPSSSWGRVRNQPSPAAQNPYTTNVYRVDNSKEQEDEQTEFEKLLERERHAGEEEEKGRW